MATIDDEIFNVEQAAAFAKVTPAVIRRWFDEGLRHMPTVAKVARTGPRQEIIRRSTLLAFIESREVGGFMPPEPTPADTKNAPKGRKATTTSGESWRAGR